MAAFIEFLTQYRNIPANDGAVLENLVQHRTVAAGEYLSPRRAVCRELFFICHGVLRIVMQNDKGNDITYHFVKENQFCTLLDSFTNNKPVPEGIQACCDSEVIAISQQNLRELYKKLPYFEGIIETVIKEGLLRKIEMQKLFHNEDASNRYRLFVQQHPDIALRVPLGDIASYLRITPQSLSRIRKNKQ